VLIFSTWCTFHLLL